MSIAPQQAEQARPDRDGPPSDLERVAAIIAEGGHWLRCSRCEKSQAVSEEALAEGCWPECCGAPVDLICPTGPRRADADQT